MAEPAHGLVAFVAAIQVTLITPSAASIAISPALEPAQHSPNRNATRPVTVAGDKETGQMRAGIRERLTGACDAVIAVTAVLVIVASHSPWARGTLAPPAPDVMRSPGQATGLYAHPSLWAVTAISFLQLVLLLARYYPRGRLRVPGDGVLLAVGSGLACLIIARDILAMPAPWAGIYAISDSAPFPWWSQPEVLDGTTLVMTVSYGAPVAAAAALTSLVFSIASPGPPAVLPGRHAGGIPGTAAD